jgi:hypothetical protein
VQRVIRGGAGGAPELVVGAAAVGDDLHAVEGEGDVRGVGREQLLARLRRQRGVPQRQDQVAWACVARQGITRVRRQCRSGRLGMRAPRQGIRVVRRQCMQCGECWAAE